MGLPDDRLEPPGSGQVTIGTGMPISTPRYDRRSYHINVVHNQGLPVPPDKPPSDAERRKHGQDDRVAPFADNVTSE